MRTNIVLDDQLMAEAFAVSRATTKKELIHEALRELVASRKRKNLAELWGTDMLRKDYDYKAMRAKERDGA